MKTYFEIAQFVTGQEFIHSIQVAVRKWARGIKNSKLAHSRKTISLADNILEGREATIKGILNWASSQDLIFNKETPFSNADYDELVEGYAAYYSNDGTPETTKSNLTIQ